MKQTTLSVPLEVKPQSCAQLTALIDALKRREETPPFNYPENYGRILREVPTLHFMSMSVFPSDAFDPLFILEANFDGGPGVFWGQMEAALGEDLRAILRCCKAPRDDDAELYAAVTAAGSRAPVAPYFEARTERPTVFHHGNRGLTRDRVLDDAALFVALRDEIDRPDGASPYRGTSARDAHAALRAAMLPRFAWLEDKAPKRIGALERATDLARLLLFAVVALLVLSLPGLVLAPLLPWRGYLVLIAILGLVIALAVFLNRKGPPGEGIAGHFPLSAFKPKFLLLLLLAVAAYAAIATLLLIPSVWAAGQIGEWLGAGPAPEFEETWRPVARAVVLGLAGIFVSIPLLLLWLRYLEKRDSAHDAPRVDEDMLRQMVRREDWIAQNHMGSIVLIKPGILRAIIIRAGHLGLGLLLRVIATSGYLGSMRTVHFAHWAFLNNGSRLLFFSNFDLSWDSYLDDFIEKAHEGLTVAWGCGVGFPPTRFLIYEGASHGRQFKNWALASRAVSRFWYSAYRDLTVDQIERNHRIANGLRRARLSEKDAAAWMRDL
ncbi:MAG: hypothetical protein ACT4N8_10465 [Sphingosinicella sp.]|uniref:hypothetical protein n=1 Tax=Sphingosinicella sp. TaxID=1917971 RepID=UPI00403815CD